MPFGAGLFIIIFFLSSTCFRYIAYLQMLLLPSQVKGYREVRYPAMEKVMSQATQQLHQMRSVLVRQAETPTFPGRKNNI